MRNLILSCLCHLLAAAALAAPPTDLTWAATPGDPRVGTYTSSPWGFNTNSHWIAGPQGTVLVDVQFLPSAATQAVGAAEQATGNKVTDAVVLHVNPDKFNGTPALQARGIRVWTSAEVAAEIPAVHKLRSSWFAERYAPDYPTTEPKPTPFAGAADSVRLAGLDLRIHRFGLACSKAHVVVQFERHLFVGDLVSPGNHAWMELGAIDAWVQVLEKLLALDPLYIHPGRGPTAGKDALSAQIDYLRTVQNLVRAA